MTSVDSQVPLHFALLLFPTFQALDVFGPLDVLNTLALRHYPTLRLSIFSTDLNPVSTLPHPSLFPKPPASTPITAPQPTFAQSIVPTHAYNNASSPPPDIDVFLIPGGLGTRPQFAASYTPLIAFVQSYITSHPGQIKHIFTVCTGAALLAETGLLDGRRATTNKSSFARIKERFHRVNWAGKARWVFDPATSSGGKAGGCDGRDIDIWTTSGVSAGVDGIFAFVSHVYGEAAAEDVSRVLEYERRMDAEDDPFAVDS